jgi:protein TonB
LGGAVAISIVVHAVAIAIAVLGFGRQVPAAEDPATITVFVAPAPPAAAPVEEKPAEEKPAEPPKPEPPQPMADFVPPPPEEDLPVPDFKAPPPPPPKVAAPQPKPQPKPALPKPAVAAVPRTAPAAPSAPSPMVPPVSGSVSPSPAPSIVPGWNVELAAWLASHKRYPTVARSRGEEGEVLVHFTVEGDGHVSEVTVAKSSGHADLDAAAVAMLQGATVPPPGTAATRTVRIHYRLDD